MPGAVSDLAGAELDGGCDVGGVLAVRKSGTAFVTSFMIIQGFSGAESYPECFLDRIFNRTLTHVLSMQQIECSLWMEI